MKLGACAAHPLSPPPGSGAARSSYRAGQPAEHDEGGDAENDVQEVVAAHGLQLEGGARGGISGSGSIEAEAGPTAPRGRTRLGEPPKP